MAETTGIAWTDATFNPWIGCTKVSPGCDGCYAAVSTPARSLGVKWGAGEARRRTSDANWRQPIHWNTRADVFRECGGCGWRGDIGVRAEPMAFACPACRRTDWREARRRVFCASLADVFDNEANPIWRWDLFNLIRATPHLDWLLLTKRIGNVKNMMILGDAGEGGRSLPQNVWLGASIVNQEEADRDVPKLLATPAAVRFVSYEPALGPVDFVPFLQSMRRGLACAMYSGASGRPALDWIIVGGESSQPGHPARPFDIQWARDTVRQCREAGVPVFVKQIGSNPVDVGCAPGCIWTTLNDIDRVKDRAGADPAEWPADLRVMDFPAGGGNG